MKHANIYCLWKPQVAFCTKLLHCSFPLVSTFLFWLKNKAHSDHLEFGFAELSNCLQNSDRMFSFLGTPDSDSPWCPIFLSQDKVPKNLYRHSQILTFPPILNVKAFFLLLWTKFRHKVFIQLLLLFEAKCIEMRIILNHVDEFNNVNGDMT